jgi:PAP2 superfamily protein
MRNTYFFKAFSTLLLFSTGASVKADVITDWNAITVKATKIAKQNSNYASRTEAIEAIAVYDAVNSIKQFGTPYHYFSHPSGSASAQAAAAEAAHDVLVTFFPAQQGYLDSALTTSLASVNDGDIASGKAVGTQAALDILSLRANDGANPDSSYTTTNTGVGQYRLTPGKFVPGVDVQWGKVKPFLLAKNDQFLPEAPPAIGSDEYNKALAEVESLGSSTSTVRTVDQTHIAQFYKQDAELTVNEGARILALAHPKPIEQTALIFALVDIAEADARIEVWGGKYLYLFWRPVTALNADADGKVTNNYSKWTPLINTPAHPSYPSGHSATITAGYDVLKAFYGDDNTIELHTTTAGEPSRTVASLSKIEWENGYSRIYGGIHYIFENNAAQNVGHKVAAYILATGPKANK